MNPTPRALRVAAFERDPYCFRCGAQPSDVHHRRSRSVRDQHTHCLCNAVPLCRDCHAEVHSQVERSISDGLIVSRVIPEPSVIPARRWDTSWVLLPCEGPAIIH